MTGFVNATGPRAAAPPRGSGLHGVGKLAQVILSSTSVTTTAIGVFKPYAPGSICDSDPRNTYWAFDSGFALTAPGGP